MQTAVVSFQPVYDPRLSSLLLDLLSEEHLPPVDRWFSGAAKRAGWSVPEQKQLWDLLRRALTRVYRLLPKTAGPEATSWPGLRIILRGRAAEWAQTAAGEGGNLAGSGIAPWLTDAFESRVSRSAWTAGQRARFLESQEKAAPVHVRFRTGADGESSFQRLRQTRAVEPSEVEGIFQLSGGRGLEGGEDWKNGLVEIQDAASQLSLNQLGLRPGMRVWDVCAGRGGKTLLAAQELRGKGAIVATDIAEAKLRALKERIRRSGWQNIRILAWGGETVPDFGPEMSKGFDRVIVDAPCSASGTWRRDPEGRFRLTPAVLSELVKHQRRLLGLGWSALKPQGRLAYVTCSWLPSENEEVVDDFVKSSGARIVGQELLGLPDFDANTLFVSVLEKP